MGNEAPEVSGLTPQHFQSKLASLIAEARAFVIAEDEDSVSDLLRGWLPSMRLLLSKALAVLDELEEVMERATSTRDGVRTNWSRSANALIPPRAFEELSDLCFIAAAEGRA